jgi:hypothetical protein
MLHRRFAIVLLTTLSACAGRTPQLVVAPPVLLPVAEAPPPPALPAGASPGMAVPAMLADGSFPTPNRALTPAAAVWHLRAGLNVAALACRADEATVVARYNAFIGTHRVELAQAEAAYAAEFRTGGGDWRDRYDDAMTRLYNYYATPPAQAAFCATAAELLAEAEAAPTQSVAAFATGRLSALDRPFTDFYRAYDAWRSAQVPNTPAPATLPPVVIASVGSGPPRPRLQLDLTAIADEGVATAR